MKWFVICVALHLPLLVTSADPLVTLSHGGQYEGKSITFNGTRLDLFIGIGYAKPPTGALRFKKTEAPSPWTGVKQAKSPGGFCSQPIPNVGIDGEEDCLYMDITVPGGVPSQANQTQVKKAVMLWIHGGGYAVGTGRSYIGAPLAVSGDVVVVTINYRLGIMGFLSDGSGTGNFGLWDQRQAIIWVKENIDNFGGDPDRITIFGESAGSASVSAQVMGQHNNGLFQRAIQESGSLYTDWGWFLTEKRAHEINNFLKSKASCSASTPIYDCLKDKTLQEIESYRTEYEGLNIGKTQWHPYPDNNFFSVDITKEDYTFPTNVDLLAGFNGQEGGVALSYFSMGATNKTLNGVSTELARIALKGFCSKYTPMSVGLCVDFLMNNYGITSAPDDQERGVRLSYAYGELSFNADVVRQLRAHSKTNRTTHAYYFTNLYLAPPEYQWWPVPAWLKKSADHADELAFVWGAALVKQNSAELKKAYLEAEMNAPVTSSLSIYESTPDSFKPLTTIIMNFWTNFAKSGDPNRPVPPPGNVPWPEFTPTKDEFMELNSNGIKLVQTPEKARLEKVKLAIFKARTQQIAAEQAPVVKACKDQSKTTQKPGASGLDVIG